MLDKIASSWITNRLIYYKLDNGAYTLVSFMDNTIISESMSTLFRYTLIFGGIAIVGLFFLAVFLARKIVRSLDESYKKQKQFISDAGHELKTPVSVVNANAIRHGTGGKDVWLSLAKEHGHVKLSVINVGEAIPEEQQDQLFERFYRVDAARNGEEKHYGLGLAMAITEAHHGKIEALCYNGLVEFCVLLPLA